MLAMGKVRNSRYEAVSFILLVTYSVLTGAAAPSAPPAPAPSPVTEKLYGTEILDNYRGFEQLDAATLQWIKSEGTYARTVLDSIPARAGLAQRLEAFQAQFALSDSVQRAGNRTFYRLRAARADDFDLVVREGKAVRKLVDIHAMRMADGGAPYSINY